MRGGEGGAVTAAERGRNHLNGIQDFRAENGSSLGQNLALAGLVVPTSLDSDLVPRIVFQGSRSVI